MNHVDFNLKKDILDPVLDFFKIFDAKIINNKRYLDKINENLKNYEQLNLEI